jgi:hypothetical protein
LFFLSLRLWKNNNYRAGVIAIAVLPRPAHSSDVDFLGCAQDHRHCLFMDRLDDGIREDGQKCEDVGLHWPFLFLPHAVPARPDASEPEERFVLIKSKPMEWLLLGGLLPVFRTRG